MVNTRNRVRLAAVGVGLWSLATFLSGFVDTFTHLFIAHRRRCAEAGFGLGIAVIIGGLVGIIGGTTLADRLAGRGMRDGKFG
ncbi:hypothetical protein [Sphingomonas sp.]|uniref:hypothetical protein n=1 Tax=Sphingomonas sp. TaxID=28214 RepID=UPI0025D67B6F|nr:hypothetical protein [Sphingomonas sp.]